MSQTTSYTGNPFTSYSSFFSSGLLAQSHSENPRLRRRGTFNSDISEPWDDELSDSSRPSSPVALADDSAMDIDIDRFASTLLRRSATPTPRSQAESQSQGETTPAQGAGAGAGVGTSKSNLSTSQTGGVLSTPTTRLRRRRSSLTLGTSPMNSIRSATRAAGNALHLQKQIPTAGLARSRSGSIGSDTVSLYAGMASGVATEGTSLVGRMRSGSCSSVVSLPSPAVGMGVGVGVMAPVSRPRRTVRRIHTTPMPALRAPPPNAPLPALPSMIAPSVASMGPVRLRPVNVNLAAVVAAQPPANSLKSPTSTSTSARARGLSVSNSGLDGAEHRIDEMKEN